jgi:hypothetical protein
VLGLQNRTTDYSAAGTLDHTHLFAVKVLEEIVMGGSLANHFGFPLDPFLVGCQSIFFA